MGNKIKITEENYKEVVLKRSIIICWVLLAICFAIYIFGGEYFNIVCSNERFVSLCNRIDNSFCYYIVAFIFYFTTTFLFYFAVTVYKKIEIKNLILLFISIMISFLSRCISLQVGQIVDFISYFIVCIIVCKMSKVSNKETAIRLFVGFVLNNTFQLISMVIKNLGSFNIIMSNSLIQIIFSIDYIILLVLYVLYNLLRI